jgi:glycosyltransferase involved in cell wall biosynthesis
VKIGFDAKRLYNNFTGIGNYSRFVVNALDKFYPDNQYVLFTPKVKHNEDTLPFIKSKHLETVLPSRWVNSVGLGSAWRSFYVGHEANNNQINLYHGLSQELPNAVPNNIQTVVTIHDLIFIRYPQFYNPIDVAIYKTKVRHACKRASCIVSISEQTSHDLIEFMGVDSAKIKVVYQGCHANFKRQFSTQQLAAIKAKYNLPDNFLLNVGTIESRKNALLIVKALRVLKGKLNTPLVIVGKATGYLKIIKEYALQHNLQEQIVYIHNVEFIDLPGIYKLASLFVYPSLFEGFGIPLVEAITCGVPVVTSKGSCFSEAAGPSSIYVSPDNEEELAIKIEQVLSDRDLRSKMTFGATEYIKRFEPECIASDLMGVYNSVINIDR